MALQAFHYEVPAGTDDEPKSTVTICQTGQLTVGVQVVRKGGETNLHAHHGPDEIWWVIAGKAAFYDENDEKVILEKNDVVLIPSDVKYWFEAIGEEPLEVLRAAGENRQVPDTRVDATPPPARLGKGTRVQARVIAATP